MTAPFKHFMLVAFTSLNIVIIHAQTTTLYPPEWHPESVTSDGKYLYVTNIGKEFDPLAKDGNGEIRKFSLTGKLIENSIAKIKLNAPKGIAVIKNTAYVSDLDRVIGIDLTSGNKVADIDFSSFNTQFINDVAVKNDTELFVTATDLNKIFLVGLGKNPLIEPLAIPEIKGANGIYYDAFTKRLYIAGLGSFTATQGEGEVGYIDWNAGKPVYHQLPGITGFFDGIVATDENTIVVSDWVNLSKAEGLIKQIDVRTGATTLLNKEPLPGPADFYFEKKTNRLIIPGMQEGKIIQLELKK